MAMKKVFSLVSQVDDAVVHEPTDLTISNFGTQLPA
jgi:hypothetical protein